jgi:hypothetical protein
MMMRETLRTVRWLADSMPHWFLRLGLSQNGVGPPHWFLRLRLFQSGVAPPQSKVLRTPISQAEGTVIT